MSPDWFANPQHIVAGLVLATLITAVAARWIAWPIAGVLALSLTMTAEALVEVVEWPLLHGSGATAEAYYDTIADIGATLLGALLGTALGLVVHRVLTRGRSGQGAAVDAQRRSGDGAGRV